MGCILGTALGDSIGLPYEGLSKRRTTRLLGEPDRHWFLLQRGMISDDTEHTVMVAQALIATQDSDSFCRFLARKFRFWLAMIPAGIGLATLKSIVRLWFGVPPDRSGVYSAGNGPAMRAAILGATLDDLSQIREWNRSSTRITHTDPKAEYGALAVATAAHSAKEKSKVSSGDYLDVVRSILDQDAIQLLELISDVVSSVHAGESTESFAKSIGLDKGVSGYVYHSVPVAIHAWLTDPCDFKAAISSVIRCGGDTDSTAAIVGGIIGTGIGEDGLPQDWLDGLIEWPCSISFMTRLGQQLAESIESDRTAKPIGLPTWGLIPRNAFFASVVLFHGFRRLLPPY